MKAKNIIKQVQVILIMLVGLATHAQANTKGVPNQYWLKNSINTSIENQWLYQHSSAYGDVYLRKNGFSYVQKAIDTDTLYQQIGRAHV